MTTPYNLITLPLGLENYQVQAELPGLSAAQAPFRSARGRSGDILVVHLALDGTAPLSDKEQKKLLKHLVSVYFKTPGSATAAMRTVAERLNDTLIERNLRGANRSLESAGLLTLAVFRENRLYLAQCGPSHTFLIQSGETSHFYLSDLAWRGLGFGRVPEIRYHQVEIHPGDLLLISANPPAAWTTTRLNSLWGEPLETMSLSLVDGVGSDLSAGVVQVKDGGGKLKLLQPDKVEGLADAVVPGDPFEGDAQPVEFPQAAGFDFDDVTLDEDGPLQDVKIPKIDIEDESALTRVADAQLALDVQRELDGQLALDGQLVLDVQREMDAPPGLDEPSISLDEIESSPAKVPDVPVDASLAAVDASPAAAEAPASPETLGSDDLFQGDRALPDDRVYTEDPESIDGRTFVSEGPISQSLQEIGRSGPPISTETARRGLMGMPHWAWGVVGLVLVGLVIGLVYVLGGGLRGKFGAGIGIAQTSATPAATTLAPSPEPTETATHTLTPLPPSPTPIPPTATTVPTPTLTPRFRVGSTQISPVDGMVMVFVPAGNFLMGASDGDPLAQEDEVPQRSVNLAGFWIDQTEVTTAQYALCTAEYVCRSPYSLGSFTHNPYFGVEAYADYPVVYVSWYDAQDYCEWAGRRVPTEAEWEKAARGTDGRTYPWGEELDCEVANYSGCRGDTTPVLSNANGASPYGALNMAGNVWEWVADIYNIGYYAVAPLDYPTGPESGAYRVIRGGSWNDEGPFLRTASRYWYYPGNARVSVGFRCALSETP